MKLLHLIPESFRQAVYYSVTNFLVITGAAALISGLWYYLFCVR